MAEDEGLEPTKPKPPVFKPGALPIMLILRTEKLCKRMSSIARFGGDFPVSAQDSIRIEAGGDIV